MQSFYFSILAMDLVRDSPSRADVVGTTKDSSGQIQNDRGRARLGLTAVTIFGTTSQEGKCLANVFGLRSLP